jgi:hypothetical protein
MVLITSFATCVLLSFYQEVALCVLLQELASSLHKQQGEHTLITSNIKMRCITQQKLCVQYVSLHYIMFSTVAAIAMCSINNIITVQTTATTTTNISSSTINTITTTTAITTIMY